MNRNTLGNFGLSNIFTEIKVNSGSKYVYLLLCVCGLASLPLALVSSREYIDESLRMALNEAEISPEFTMISRLLNGVIGVILLLIAKNAMVRRSDLTFHTRNVALGIFVFTLFNYGIGAVLGDQPGPPSIYLVLSQFALMLLVVTPSVNPLGLLLLFKYIAVGMVLGSIGVGIIFPDFSYMGADILSSSDFGERRLIGFFSHPSLLGIYALLLFAVELKMGFEGWRHWVILSISVIGLVMSTSKTGLVLAVIFGLWSAGRGGVFKTLLTITTLTLTFVYLIYSGYLSGSDINDYATLTGRTGLWAYLIEMWLQNPIFGVGPAYFSNVNEIGFAHAHNIFLQALVDGGVLGLLALLIYVFSLIAIGFHNTVGSNSLSISLVVLMVIFSLSEPVMRIDSFVGNTFFVNSFIIMYLCSLDRHRLERGTS